MQTAGILLGLEFPHVPDKAAALREARLATVSRIVALAEHEKAGALLIAGNSFADNRIDARTVADFAERLRKSTVPVYLLPGLLDPLTPDSPYNRFPDLWTEPIHVCRQAEAIALDAHTSLFPLPLLGREDRADFGLAEPGTVIMASADAEELPEDPPADFLALGGEPGPAEHRGHWYPGTPEPTDFDGDGGFALVIDLESKKVTPREVGTYLWRTLSGDPGSVEKEAAKLARPLETLLRVQLEGAEADPALLDRLNQRFFHVDLVDHTVPDLQFGAPILRRLVQRLQETAAAEEPDLEPGALGEADVARAALRRLAAMTAGMEV